MYVIFLIGFVNRANKRVQGTRHKVSGPLARDVVQGDNDETDSDTGSCFHARRLFGAC